MPKFTAADFPDPEVTPQVLTKVDQDAILAEEAARVETVLWDKTSPINGVDAQHFLDRDDVDKFAEIYLIRDTKTKQVLVFQPHEPGVEGLKRMKSKTKAMEVGASHKAKMVERKAFDRIAEEAKALARAQAT